MNKKGELNKCFSCNGSKVISPLGGIEKKCKVCNGIGMTASKPMISEAQAVKILDKALKVDKRSKAYRDSLK